MLITFFLILEFLYITDTDDDDAAATADVRFERGGSGT